MFGRIFHEIKKFVTVFVPVIDQLVGFRADSVVSSGVVMTGAMVIAIIKCLSPVFGGFAA